MGRRKKSMSTNDIHVFFSLNECYFVYIKTYKKTLWYFPIDVKLAYLLYLYRTSFNTFHIIAKFIFD